MSLKKLRNQLEAESAKSSHTDEFVSPIVFKKGEKCYTSVNYDVEVGRDKLEGKRIVSFGKQ